MPLVRVPWLDPGIIMKSLDAGAYGVICPMVNTREDAQRLVASMRYPPGAAQLRAHPRFLYGGPDYPQHANDTIVAFAMIETRRRSTISTRSCRSRAWMRSISGPPTCRWRSAASRSSTMTIPSWSRRSTISWRRPRSRLVAGIHNRTPDYALKMIAKGFSFVTIASDARLMAAGAQQVVAAMKAAGSEAGFRVRGG